MTIKCINNFQKPISILLLFCILFVFSCSINDSITGSNNNSLDKLVNPTNVNSTQSDDYIEVILKKYNVTFVDVVLIGSLCLFLELKGFKLPEIPEDDNNNEKLTYKFRDEFLSTSKKGESYTASYYLLSKYGIENNLVMKFSMEHLSLMNTGIEVSQEIQHGTNDNQILINRSTYDDCKDIVTIYRNSDNHEDIDIVLDYLETDLEKYYNKTKAEIAVDFVF